MSENNNFVGYIYVLTSPSGKSYVGQTTRTPEKRWKQHVCASANVDNSHPLYEAIRKYGWENFDKEIFAECDSREELDREERYFIKNMDSLAPNGYNLNTGGGTGFIASEESRKKMSESAKLRDPPKPAERKNGLDQNL